MVEKKYHFILLELNKILREKPFDRLKEFIEKEYDFQSLISYIDGLLIVEKKKDNGARSDYNIAHLDECWTIYESVDAFMNSIGYSDELERELAVMNVHLYCYATCKKDVPLPEVVRRFSMTVRLFSFLSFDKRLRYVNQSEAILNETVQWQYLAVCWLLQTHPHLVDEKTLRLKKEYDVELDAHEIVPFDEEEYRKKYPFGLRC